MRRRHLEALYARTEEQIKEEETLVHELKRRELYEDKWNKDRDAILRSLKDHELPPGQAISLVSTLGESHQKIVSHSVTHNVEKTKDESPGRV